MTLFEHILDRASLTEEEAADYLRQAAMALSVAHSQAALFFVFKMCPSLWDDTKFDIFQMASYEPATSVYIYIYIYFFFGEDGVVKF